MRRTELSRACSSTAASAAGPGGLPLGSDHPAAGGSGGGDRRYAMCDCAALSGTSFADRPSRETAGSDSRTARRQGAHLGEAVECET
jgi:hypothetical protein